MEKNILYLVVDLFKSLPKVSVILAVFLKDSLVSLWCFGAIVLGLAITSD